MSREGTRRPGKSKGKEDIERWLSQLKSWFVTSEPSSQAFKQHKKDIYKNAGVALDDPRASAKLHIPATIMPEEAIKPAGRGPDPEDLARKRAELRRSRVLPSYTNSHALRSTASYSTGSSVPSVRQESELRLPRRAGR